jgi:hypothetical protein
LNSQEQVVLSLLGEAWNQFLMLAEIHPYDNTEFMSAIHHAQLIILARPAIRQGREDREAKNDYK